MPSGLGSTPLRQTWTIRPAPVGSRPPRTHPGATHDEWPSSGTNVLASTRRQLRRPSPGSWGTAAIAPAASPTLRSTRASHVAAAHSQSRMRTVGPPEGNRACWATFTWFPHRIRPRRSSSLWPYEPASSGECATSVMSRCSSRPSKCSAPACGKCLLPGRWMLPCANGLGHSHVYCCATTEYCAPPWSAASRHAFQPPTGDVAAAGPVHDAIGGEPPERADGLSQRLRPVVDVLRP
jgi:hypothetical protein